MASPSDYRLEIAAEPSPPDRQFLEDRLYEFNRRQVGKGDGQLLGVFLRDGHGEMVAGLTGWTWAGACEIQAVWVKPELRGQGHGRRLMEAAEQEARARGTETVFLSSYSFQAPGFYEKLGYEVVFRLPDVPPGHEHVVLRKRIV
jgi:ribosomal protein S18 acetylase RimI-like enzyme